MRILIFLPLLICTISCNNDSKNNIAKIKVGNSELNELKLSSLLNKSEYIPLETTKESIIGVVEKIKFYDSLIFILDPYFAGKLLVFNSQGKYLYDIGTKGKGPSEYNFIADFTIHNKKIYLIDNRTNIKTYNIQGEFIEQFNLDFWCDRISYIGKHTFCLTTLMDYTPKYNSSIYLTDMSFNLIEHTGSTDYLLFRTFPIQHEHMYNDLKFFIRTYENKIYSIVNKKVVDKYELEIPTRLSITKELYEKYKKINIRHRIKMEEDIIILLNMFRTNIYTVFCIENRKEPQWCIYNKETESTKSVSLKNIINDIDGTAITPNIYSNLHKNNLVGIINPANIEKDHIDDLNPKLLKIISDSKNENPIITIYTFN